MSEAVVLPHRAPYTVDDLFAMPDDGNRYEVVEGVLRISAPAAPIEAVAELPLAVGPTTWTTVKLDPAVLLDDL